MTLIWGENGIARALLRRKGEKPLHLSLRTTAKREAQNRYAAVRLAYRTAPANFIDAMRDGRMPVERVTAMVNAGEPLVLPAILAAPLEPAPVASLWGTVDKEAERYLDRLALRQRRSNTIALAGFQLKRFRDATVDGARIGDRTVDAVTSDIIHAYQKSLVDAETPANTITTYMSRVSALWRWLIAQEQRDAREQRRDPRPLYNPVDAETLLRETHRRDRVLTKEEAERLWAATPEPLQWIVGCGLLAGLRIEEALHLRPGLDVDLELGTITIRDQPDWKPKTKRSRRLVPMAPALLAVAKRHAERWASASWMTPSPVYADRPLGQLGFRKHFIVVVERAELVYGRGEPHGVTYHTLRHSFASHAVMRGVDLYTVAKLLGDSVKMVEDVYADLSPDFKRSAIAKLAGAFGFSANDTASDTGATENE